LASSSNPTFARITFCSVVIVLVPFPAPEDFYHQCQIKSRLLHVIRFSLRPIANPMIGAEQLKVALAPDISPSPEHRI
jgi:hypothetical protein